MAIEPGSNELERFRQGDDGKPVVLVQLLRFTEGGRERYLEYAAIVKPILLRIGAQILYAGESGPPLIGDAWQGIVVTRYPRRSAYLAMLADPEYQAIAPLRRAALREVVMLPTNDWPGR